MASAAPKRSLFSKPSWATAAAPIAKTDDDDAIFGRSQIYEDIIAEKRRKKEKQAARAKTTAGFDSHNAKRRRISQENEDNGDSDATSGKSENSTETHKEDEERAGPVTRSTPAKSKFAAALDSPVKQSNSKAPQPEAASILLDDDDVQITATQRVKPSASHPIPSEVLDPPESDRESEGDDEYDQKLKRIAREHAFAQKRAEVKATPPAEPSASAVEAVQLIPGSPSKTEDVAKNDEGPLVKIWITSIYPNTKALIVTQPASRNLKRVKEVWCMKQGFSTEKAKEFFFTWNGAKLFDSSNLMNTLEVLKMQRPNEDDPSGGKIHLEVMNAEIKEHRRKQKEREEIEASRPAEHGQEQEATPEEPPPPPEPRCIISLRAEGMEPMQLKVRSSTLISKIMIGFQQHKGIDANKTCWLMMDGARLEPESTVQDAEIEDGDIVEVIIR